MGKAEKWCRLDMSGVHEEGIKEREQGETKKLGCKLQHREA
jgi:hypothetical protein